MQSSGRINSVRPPGDVTNCWSVQPRHLQHRDKHLPGTCIKSTARYLITESPHNRLTYIRSKSVLHTKKGGSCVITSSFHILFCLLFTIIISFEPKESQLITPLITSKSQIKTFGDRKIQDPAVCSCY